MPVLACVSSTWSYLISLAPVTISAFSKGVFLKGFIFSPLPSNLTGDFWFGAVCCCFWEDRVFFFFFFFFLSDFLSWLLKYLNTQLRFNNGSEHGQHGQGFDVPSRTGFLTSAPLFGLLAAWLSTSDTFFWIRCLTCKSALASRFPLLEFIF